MENCIFCKIVKGDAPCHKVYEDEEFLAFLDINPITKGHTMIIPKEHVRWVWDVPKYNEYMNVVKKIALAQRKAFDTDWVTVKIYGEDVAHAHVWVFPQKRDGPFKCTGRLEIPKDEMEEIAKKIRESI